MITTVPRYLPLKIVELGGVFYYQAYLLSYRKQFRVDPVPTIKVPKIPRYIHTSRLSQGNTTGDLGPFYRRHDSRLVLLRYRDRPSVFRHIM